jgi:hypothetical protein
MPPTVGARLKLWTTRAGRHPQRSRAPCPALCAPSITGRSQQSRHGESVDTNDPHTVVCVRTGPGHSTSVDANDLHTVVCVHTGPDAASECRGGDCREEDDRSEDRDPVRP